MSDWLLTPAGNALHLSQPGRPIFARCGVVLSMRRTVDHGDLIAQNRHPHCKRCAAAERPQEA